MTDSRAPGFGSPHPPERCTGCTALVHHWRGVTYSWEDGAPHRCPPDIDLGTVEADYRRMMRQHVGEEPEDVLDRLRGRERPETQPDTPKPPQPHPNATTSTSRVVRQRTDQRAAMSASGPAGAAGAQPSLRFINLS